MDPHVVMRHSTCNLTKQQTIGTWAGLGQMVAGDRSGEWGAGLDGERGDRDGDGTRFFADVQGDDEKQADLLGAGILYDAGYDPRGLPQFFETIQAKYGSGGSQFFSDHPNPGNRTQYVNAEIATFPPRANETVSLRRSLRRFERWRPRRRPITPKEVQAGAWRQTGKYALVAGGPAQVIPAAPSRGRQGEAAGVRLSRSALGLNDRMVAYQGAGFSVSYPASWQKGEGQNGSVAFVPLNGAGQSGIAYGALIDSVRFKTSIMDANSLAQWRTSAVAQQLSQQNGGMQAAKPVGVGDCWRAAGECGGLRGRSPVADGGSALAERDWLVTVVRPDGSLSYMVFVAPEPDFAALKPVFSAMVASFRAR